MPAIKFVLNDGTEHEVDPSAPWTVREQIDWEQEFKASFVSVFQAVGAEIKARQIIEASGVDDDDARVPAEFKVAWLLWFGWHRLRPKVATKFSVFVDSQLADYDLIPDPEPTSDSADGVDSAPAVAVVDPTIPAGSSDLAP